MRGRAAKKARIDAFFKPKAPAATRGPVTWDAPKRTNPVSTNLEVKPTVDDAGLVTIQLPKNRVGLWFLELEEKGGGLRCVALERFDLYNKVEAQSEAFHAHVARMPAGRVALVSITDTAMAKTRPLPKLVYDTLRLLGGEDHIEPIGYRTVRKSTSVLGAPDNSSLHFSAMTRPTWLSRAARNRHRHAIEQASRQWRGGRRGDSARTRRKILISTQVPTTPPSPAPSALPTTSVPTTPPSEVPSPVPTSKPSAMPTAVPIPAPSGQPTPRPTPKPTPAPTAIPGNPTGAPVFSPTPRPTPTPTPRPSEEPTPGPSPRPTHSPSTALPSSVPTTSMPSAVPTSYPTAVYVSGQLKVAGMSLDVALEYKDVFVVALAALAGVSADRVEVLITAARRRLAVEIAAAMAVRSGLGEDFASGRRRLSGGVNIEYTISVDAASATAASEGLSEATPTDVDSAIESAAANFVVNGTNSSSAFSSIQTNSITAEVVVEGGPPPEPPNITAAVPRSASKPRIIYQRKSRGVGAFWNATARVHRRIAWHTERAAERRKKDISDAKDHIARSDEKTREAKKRAEHGYAHARHEL